MSSAFLETPTNGFFSFLNHFVMSNFQFFSVPKIVSKVLVQSHHRVPPTT